MILNELNLWSQKQAQHFFSKKVHLGIYLTVLGILIFESIRVLLVAAIDCNLNIAAYDAAADREVWNVLLFAVLCYGLLQRTRWSWWLGIIWIGVDLLPVSESQFDLKLVSSIYLVDPPLLLHRFVGEPIRVLCFLYLVTHRQLFDFEVEKNRT